VKLFISWFEQLMLLLGQLLGRLLVQLPVFDQQFSLLELELE